MAVFGEAGINHAAATCMRHLVAAEARARTCTSVACDMLSTAAAVAVGVSAPLVSTWSRPEIVLVRSDTLETSSDMADSRFAIDS